MLQKGLNAKSLIAVSEISRGAEGGELALKFWQPGLTSLPLLAGVRRMHQSDIDFADVRVVEGDGKREMIATFAGDGPSPRNRETFTEWAVLVGYERVWLGDEMLDLGDRTPDLSEAAVTCRGCGTTIVCAGSEFWAKVLQLGHFPKACGYCGSALPEWHTAETEAGRVR